MELISILGIIFIYMALLPYCMISASVTIFIH